MAYTMTHILIAEKVLGFFDCPIDYDTYIVGSIAPDAVHANPNYSPELKEKSHLFADGLKWGEVASEKEYDEWLDSIKEFYFNNYFKYDRDFFLGYIVHVLTDICSNSEIYAPFYKSLAQDEIAEKKKQFSYESYCVNYYLFREYSKDKRLVDTLKKGRSYSIPNIYDDSIFENRINQLFDFEFKKWDIDTIEKNSICTIENTIALIEKAPTVIKKIFIDDFYRR
ncbi:zinc dependent phospholipase C family protein [Butyrivibrio sp. TB]|jgi:hypothetical protein|uniref:zinc dependent phospholipase C family protein n=1 Tax=Butyrivibrio sp. TB TaxID=1520809 RepID=UPI0008C3B5C0|nr:zinc dependent phospholipase C family protein [Butyrivibrio sp. TB]SEP59659.1 Zinc dependent phospholipase C [Butyrivibrio sp. TB]